jgi:hypothetical protein
MSGIIGAAVEKVAEKAKEKATTFFEKLESKIDVEKSDIEKKTEKVKEFWGNLEKDDSDDVPGERKPDSGENADVQGLSEEEKTKIKETHTDWPDEIINSIGSWEEYKIYDEAGLKVEYVDGKPCLIRKDIDMEQKDFNGRTNRQRMEEGLAPQDRNGRPIELHHIGQKTDSPLAELKFEEHHCNGNDSILHDKTKETEVHGEGNTWDQERQKHWETRSHDS